MNNFLNSIVLILLFTSCTNIKPIATTDTNPISVIKENSKTKAVKVIDEIKKKQTETLPPKEIVIKNTDKVKKYCKKIDKYFKKYKWSDSNCEDYSWNHVRSSHWGNPIIWHTFGNESKAKETSVNTTLILCGVHGDEITPIKFCFDILKDLKKHPEVIKNNLVIVAPIVTPDSFFKKYPTRTNGRGIDVNRNFPTKDWKKSARKLWKNRYKMDKRRNPGLKPLSEQDTIFQVNLIKRYSPDKIISVHAPLTLIDYDGPTHKHGEQSLGQQLLIQMSDKAGKYRVNNYPFFPGSLGNWAGNERRIPTYTLELPNTDWTKTKKYYKTFRLAIHHAIEQKLQTNEQNKKITENKKVAQKTNDKVL